MQSWTSLGHAMRRRIGAPSNHHESAGKNMARNTPTPEEVISSAEHSSSPRRYVGMDQTNFSNVSGTPVAGTPVARKNTQALDPTFNGKANKSNVLVDSAIASERMGARYGISVKFPAHVAPEAGPTMANARVVPSIAGKSRPNFDSGNSSAY